MEWFPVLFATIFFVILVITAVLSEPTAATPTPTPTPTPAATGDVFRLISNGVAVTGGSPAYDAYWLYQYNEWRIFVWNITPEGEGGSATITIAAGHRPMTATACQFTDAFDARSTPSMPTSGVLETDAGLGIGAWSVEAGTTTPLTALTSVLMTPIDDGKTSDAQASYANPPYGYQSGSLRFITQSMYYISLGLTAELSVTPVEYKLLTSDASATTITPTANGNTVTTGTEAGDVNPNTFFLVFTV